MVRKNYKETFRKGRITQAWNLLNLYNLSAIYRPNTTGRTFFQQKWTAKADSRTYHGRQVREKQWQLMFSRRIPAVVEMDPARLANDDGSRQAAGRGSGTDRLSSGAKKTPKNTPYMAMTYWPLERRLDTAIFRAMFASSVRMARQYVVHGHVKVNGKKMRYPGYMLNPGDMFSIDPDLVMLGTGLKDTDANQKLLPQEIDNYEKVEDQFVLKQKKTKLLLKQPAAEAVEDSTSGAEATAEAVAQVQPKVRNLRAELKEIDRLIARHTNPELRKGYVFRTRGKRRLFRLRKLRREIKEALKNHDADPNAAVNPTAIRVRFEGLKPTKGKANPVKAHMLKSQLLAPKNPPSQNAGKKPKQYFTHLELLKTWPNARLQDKPYLTPWLPRHWMSAFAFIPRYLEVNQNVCSAVYLRHPVARPGMAEVPSPFTPDTNMLAYQWYLRRR